MRTFTADHIGLIEGFLNPLAFDADGTQVAHTLTDDVAAGAIIRGMTRQVGNEIDEFVTTALRNNLLGLPLDLATINLARGRDTGVPSLNEARRYLLSRRPTRTSCSSPTTAGSISPATSNTKPRSSTSSRPMARTR